MRTVLGHLNAERPAVRTPQPGQTRYVTRGGDFQKRLHLEIISRQNQARILVTGQIGVGKSSELYSYWQRQKQENGRYFWVYCDIEKEGYPEKCGTTGVFLSVFRDLWGAVHGFYQDKPPDLIQIRDEILTRLIDWLNGEYESEKKVVFRFGGMEYPVFLEEGQNDTALWLILGKAAQHESVSSQPQRLSSAPDSLINLLNKLLQWVGKKRDDVAPILIIDHVDKIRSLEFAEEVLVKAMPHWNRLNASVVMTAPMENTIGELRSLLEAHWDKPLVIYPLDIPETEDDELPQIYQRIVKNAQLNELIDPDGLRHMAYYSGGIPRTFVQFLIQAAKEAHLAQHDRISPGDARAVVDMARRAYYDYSSEALALLDKIDQEGTGLSQAAGLLRSPIGLLITPSQDERQRFRVHPLAASVLEQYRQRRQTR